jgi:uncharacterized protein
MAHDIPEVWRRVSPNRCPLRFPVVTGSSGAKSPVADEQTVFGSLDGLHLSGTLSHPAARPRRAVVLVHGGGVTREEGGFFTRLAHGFGGAGIASLRYDLRGHGRSGGSQDDATLASHLNDIRVALKHARTTFGVETTTLLGASFGGGLCAYYAAKRPSGISQLVLLNPNLTYKRYYIDNRPYWVDDHVNDEGAHMLNGAGSIALSPTLRHGRALLNEVFWIQPFDVIEEISVQTLIVHGSGDTLISIDSSREAAARLTVPHRLIEIEGAQHGFAVHDDSGYLDPQTERWQADVISDVVGWVAGESE